MQTLGKCETLTRLIFLLLPAILLILARPVVAEIFTEEAMPNKVRIRPGQEIKIVDPRCGELGYYLVYIPQDYKSDRDWPVILYYHGLGGDPQTSLFQSVLTGKSFIVVGMAYHQRGMEGYQHMTTEDVRIIRRVLDSVERSIRIDRSRLFLAGFSKGGFYTSGILNELPELWAGAIILGAGMRKEAKRAKALAGKPVLIACGSRDGFATAAREAYEYYRRLNCEVTHEQWPGVGHWVSEKNGIRRWLLKYAQREKPNSAPGTCAPASCPTALRKQPKAADLNGVLRKEPPRRGFAYIGIATSVVALAGLILWCLRRRSVSN